MGATIDYYTFTEGDKGKVNREFASAREQARYEDGHEYPGSIACFTSIGAWHNKQFASENEAVDYLTEHHQKWSPALAVSFRLPAKPTKQDKIKQERALHSFRSWESRLSEARQKIIEVFLSRKSGTVGCSNCGSRLARGFLERPDCPICNESLLGETDTNRLAKIRVRVEKAREALAEATKPRPSENIGWVVGGWCPE
jgi:hypothetical protein